MAEKSAEWRMFKEFTGNKSVITPEAVFIIVGINRSKSRLKKSQDMPKAALRDMENQDYDDAYAAFVALKNYSDSPVKAKESLYLKAESLKEGGSFDDAVVIYSKLGDYRDSADKINICLYSNAEALGTAGYAEANRYFDVTYTGSSNIESRVTPTIYAQRAGAYTSSKNKTADGGAAGWWWLRSLGSILYNAAGIDYDGALSSRSVNFDSACVRPALWINLESDIF